MAGTTSIVDLSKGSSAVFVFVWTLTQKIAKVNAIQRMPPLPIALSNNNCTTTNKNSKEEVITIGFYDFVAMLCFVVALTLAGLVYMIKTHYKCRCKCCFICKEMEKGDKNMDYATYNYDNGEQRDNVMEVNIFISNTFVVKIFAKFVVHFFLKYSCRQPTTILSTIIATTWRATWTTSSRTTIQTAAATR